MNKKIFGIIGIVVIAILLIISSFLNPDKVNYSDDPQVIILLAKEEAEEVKENEKKDFIEIDVNEYLNIYEGTEKTLVLLARPTCKYCQIAMPILQNIAYNYNLNIYYLNTDNFQEDDAERFVKSNDAFNEGFGTPTLLLVSDSKINDMVDSLVDTRRYMEFLKRNKYIQ